MSKVRRICKTEPLIGIVTYHEAGQKETFAEITMPEQVVIDGVQYILTEPLPGGECAEVFIAQASNGGKRVIKRYPSGRSASPVTRGKRNHYSMTREVSTVVFDELADLHKHCLFIPELIARERIDGRWFLVMEFVAGKRFTKFLQDNLAIPDRAKKGCELLGRALREWHDAGVAHGDPHLENALVEMEGIVPSRVRLIDLDMVHSPTFQYCNQRWGCVFDRNQAGNRYGQDLSNDDGKVGRGFLNELEQEPSVKAQAMSEALVEAFRRGYD